MDPATPPTRGATPHASLQGLMSTQQQALAAMLRAITKGGQADMISAIDQVESSGLDPDAVVFQCASGQRTFWYHPATFVLAQARHNAAALLRAMISKGLDIARHRCGSLHDGHTRPLAHAFIQGWSGARAAPVRRFDPTLPVDLPPGTDADRGHRLDSRPVLKILAQQKVDWQAIDSLGRTVIHQAMNECKVHDLRTVCLLAMENGVDPASIDHAGKTAMDIGRARMGKENMPAQRETLSFILAELSQAGLASTPTPTTTAPPARRI